MRETVASIPGLFLLADVFNPHDLGIFVIVPGGAVFDQVKAAVRAQFQVDRTFECHSGTKTLHADHPFPGVQPDGNDPAP